MKLNSTAMIRIAFWTVGILLGFSQAWAYRMVIMNDTVSYLDMGDLLFRGHWGMAVNGYWNPFFSFLLGLTMFIVNPSAYWEYPVVHLLMFLIFLFAFGCFDFFLHEMLLLRRQREAAEELHVPVWVWMTIGYTLFLWSSLKLIAVYETNPDMLVAASFYLASGLLVRMRRRGAGWWSYFGLGLVLGTGYLTKAVMFPVSLLCLAMVWLMAIRSRHAILGAMAATLVFLAVSMPLVVALSITKQKPTFGENGTVLFLVDIDHVPLTHWQGDNGKYGQLLHPVKQVVDRPATFALSGAAGVTYPVWYDPSYWYEGAKPDYRIGEIARNVATNLIREAALLLTALSGAVVASLFLLYYAGGRGRLIFRDIGESWFLLTPVTVTIGLYVLLHVDTRYVAPFFVVGLLCLFFSIHMKPVSEGGRLFVGTALLFLAMFLNPFGPGTIPKDLSPLHALVTEPLDAEPNPNADLVKALQKIGLRPGDAVASLDYSNCAVFEGVSCEAVVMWARLGHFKVAGEVMYTPVRRYTLDNNYWNAEPASQEKVLGALAGTGARIVVSWQEPRGAGAASWQRVENTHWYLRWLGTPPPGAQQG